MTIDNSMEQFAGLPVRDFDSEQELAGVGQVAYRLRMDYDQMDSGTTFADLLGPLLADPRCEQLTALVIGFWGEVGEGSEDVVEALVSASRQLRNVKAIFLGDITYEESEISWITQSDVSPIFSAYPQLEEFGVRGGNGLSLGRLQHSKLRKLVVESGGLPRSVVQEVAAADLPQLEHLELWLGDDGYGNDVTLEDLQPILSGEKFPRLRYLGLRDDYQADETAKAVAQSPILSRIEVLDLSLGTLGDEGAKALLATPAVKQLKRIDLHHHYIGKAVAAELEKLGPEVDLNEVCEPDVWDGESHRYVAVGE